MHCFLAVRSLANACFSLANVACLPLEIRWTSLVLTTNLFNWKRWQSSLVWGLGRIIFHGHFIYLRTSNNKYFEFKFQYVLNYVHRNKRLHSMEFSNAIYKQIRFIIMTLLYLTWLSPWLVGADDDKLGLMTTMHSCDAIWAQVGEYLRQIGKLFHHDGIILHFSTTAGSYDPARTVPYVS